MNPATTMIKMRDISAFSPAYPQKTTPRTTFSLIFAQK
jgi:hypothetical protein